MGLENGSGMAPVFCIKDGEYIENPEPGKVCKADDTNQDNTPLEGETSHGDGATLGGDCGIKQYFNNFHGEERYDLEGCGDADFDDAYDNPFSEAFD